MRIPLHSSLPLPLVPSSSNMYSRNLMNIGVHPLPAPSSKHIPLSTSLYVCLCLCIYLLWICSCIQVSSSSISEEEEKLVNYTDFLARFQIRFKNLMGQYAVYTTDTTTNTTANLKPQKCSVSHFYHYCIGIENLR